MDAVAETFSSLHRPDWVSWLRRELAPFPGRGAMTLRMVVAVALVTIISMTLQIPETALSAYMVFFVTKENRTVTTLAGILVIVGVTLAIAASLFLSRFTFDYPELRIPVMAGTVFIAMYLSRVFVIGPLGFAIGFVVAITQTMGETAPNGELLVHGFLWAWVALVYPIVLTIVINQILLPADPWNALVEDLAQRLDAGASTLEGAIKEGAVGGHRDIRALDLATRGSSRLLTHLKLAAMTEAHVKRRHASLVATVAASERVVRAAAVLAMRTKRPLSENDLLCAKALLLEIARLKTAVREENPILPVKRNDSVPTLPELRELQLAMASFHDCLGGKAPTPQEPASMKTKKSLFVADAFTNPAHTRFALKVTLAAMTCYFIYTGLDWPGIHTAFITCCIIALENTGATMRKGWLRLAGCSTGGLMGFLSIMYLVPHMESIVSLVLLAAAASALAGWVASGSERISYAGLQIALAFYMCIFQGFAPDTDFDTIRDRLVGIALGILVSSAVFRYLWPELAVERLRATLSKALRNLASLLLIPGIGAKLDEERKAIEGLRGEIGKGLDETARLAELAGLESSEGLDRENSAPFGLEDIGEHAQAVYLIATTLTGEVEFEAWRRMDAKAKGADAALRVGIADQLRRVALFVEKGELLGAAGLASALTVREEEIEQIPEEDRRRLLRRLIQEMKLKCDPLVQAIGVFL
jgi:multidrug resistance protein MdtO